MAKTKNVITLVMKTSGETLQLIKNFKLFRGGYKNVDIYVAVPTSILFDSVVSSDGYVLSNSVKISALTESDYYKQTLTKSTELAYVKTSVVDGVEYNYYNATNGLPKSFTAFAGTVNIIVNVRSYITKDDDTIIDSVFVSQQNSMEVLQSAMIDDDDEIFEPSEFAVLQGRVAQLENTVGDHAYSILEMVGFLQTPDVSLANEVGTANVTIKQDGRLGFEYLKGATGDKGDTGATGATGAQGIQGEKGDTGDKGDKGDKGDRGAQGAKGDKGDKGDTGAQGIQGDKGLKGDKGDKGDTGAQGIQGIQGEKGDRGGIAEAPNDSKIYGRYNSTWTEIANDGGVIKNGEVTENMLVDGDAHDCRFVYSYLGTDPKSLMTDTEIANFLFKFYYFSNRANLSSFELIDFIDIKLTAIELEVSRSTRSTRTYSAHVGAYHYDTTNDYHVYIYSTVSSNGSLHVERMEYRIQNGTQFVNNIVYTDGYLITLANLRSDNISQLETTDKTVVGAINEVNTAVGDIGTILDYINGEVV